MAGWRVVSVIVFWCFGGWLIDRLMLIGQWAVGQWTVGDRPVGRRLYAYMPVGHMLILHRPVCRS